MANRTRLTKLEAAKLDALAILNGLLRDRKVGGLYLKKYELWGNDGAVYDDIYRGLSILYAEPTYQFLKRKINKAKSVTEVKAILRVTFPGIPDVFTLAKNHYVIRPARVLSSAGRETSNRLGNPYTQLGQRRLKREFEAMSRNLALHMHNQRRARRG